MRLLQLLCTVAAAAAHRTCTHGSSCSYVNWHGHTVHATCHDGLCGGYHDDDVALLLFLIIMLPLFLWMCSFLTIGPH